MLFAPRKKAATALPWEGTPGGSRRGSIDFLLLPPAADVSPQCRTVAPLALRGPFQLVTEWFLLVDADAAPGVAFHAWNAVQRALAVAWGWGLRQYVADLPTYAGYAILGRPDIGPTVLSGDVERWVGPWARPGRALLYLTTAPVQGLWTDYAAYHTATGPDYDRPFALVAASSPPLPQFGEFGWLTIPLTHELAELLTDPTPYYGGWGAADGSETADECNWQFTTTTAPAGAGFPSFEYALTQYASNRDGRCFP